MNGPFREALGGLEGRIRGMVGRAIVRLVDDATKAQELQLELLDGESQDGVERFQNYGFTCVPHTGAEALTVFAGGLRSHGVVLAVEDRRYRLRNLEQGEVALFDDLGNTIVLGREAITVTGATKVIVDAPEVEVETGSATVTADSVLVECDDIRLGADGGEAVARVGDDIDPATNKILTGSSKVRSA